ncbi:hypothetical protein ACFFGR_09500 [Arthrobacter liuii]|uniref:Transposase n=1 Tax=Arthrobacter liuii TaxID=1476996 RepID=A0ABQ2AQP3_9MICC|nr:hypothetical protein [Arthrobacter liuii]GGH93946.1 hypothetical protein GCM10007170_16000 [Arthrobacter liuii]
MNSQGLPHIEPANGSHAGPRNREQDRKDAIQYLTNGHRILPGWGTHRATNATESWAA